VNVQAMTAIPPTMMGKMFCNFILKSKLVLCLLYTMVLTILSRSQEISNNKYTWGTNKGNKG